MSSTYQLLPEEQAGVRESTKPLAERVGKLQTLYARRDPCLSLGLATLPDAVGWDQWGDWNQFGDFTDWMK